VSSEMSVLYRVCTVPEG